MTETDAQVVRDALAEGRDWALKDHDEYSIAIFEPALASLDRILAELQQVKAERDALLEDETWHEETIAVLRTENERYREAMEQIANHFGLGFDCECPVSSRIARTALSPTTQKDRQ